jgi:hypothetical protein
MPSFEKSSDGKPANKPGVAGFSLIGWPGKAKLARISPWERHAVTRKLTVDDRCLGVLQAAVHFVTTNVSFDTALDATLRFAGPANYCPVLVGAIGGARWGGRAIDDSRLQHCRDRRRVEAVAKALAAEWGAAAPQSAGHTGDGNREPCGAVN